MFFGLFISVIFGLLFGSFGSVILSRWAKSKSIEESLSIVFGRSECPNCKTVLKSWDLIPLISFLIQGGKCRYCKKKISRFYPILELGTAIIFGSVWFLYNDQGTFILLFRMFTWRSLWLMVVYSVLRYEIHLPLLVFGSFILLFSMRKGLFQRDALRGGIVLLVAFFLLYFLARQLVKIRYHINEEGLGIGDVLVSPYLGTILFVGLSQGLGMLDYILAILYFLIFTGIVGILRYFLQTKKQTKRAHRFFNEKIAKQSLPLLPSMAIAIVLILILKQTLFGTLVI